MAYANLSTWDEVLKTFYLPAIQEQLNHDTILSDRIEVNEEDVSGKDATIECHYGRSTGTGARADGGSLPSANYQKFKTCVVPMRYNYGRVSFTGPTIRATRDERGAYARVVDREIMGIVTDLKKEINRQLWGCGYGVLARWLEGTTTSIKLQKKYRGNSDGGDGFGSTFGAKYLSENNAAVLVQPSNVSSNEYQDLDVYDTNLDVSAIIESDEYDTITCTNADKTEEGRDFYVRPGSLASVDSSDSAGAARLEMVGLRGIVTDENLDDIALYDGTDQGLSVSDPLQGLDPSTYSWFQANVDHHGSGRYGGQRALTLSLMQKMFDKVEEKAGKDYGPDMILTTRAIRREYLELCQADRITVNVMELDGGWKALDYNGVPLTVDNDAIDGEMYFLTLKDIQLYRMSDYDWMTKDGAILSRLSGYDAYEAVLFRYAELGCKRRNSQGVICDISYTD